MGFVGTYADLTSFQIGNFSVAGLVGRDKAGAPRWKVICDKCGHEQFVPHNKAATLLECKAANNLYCINQSCIASRKQHIESESLIDLRRRERREAEEAAAQADKEAAKRNTEADRQRVEREKLNALRRQYIEYWCHQTKTNASDTEIVSFDRWRQLLPSTRQMVLDRLRSDPTVYFQGL